jgi:thiosulfate dehydrogenase (quinone) large subunit
VATDRLSAPVSLAGRHERFRAWEALPKLARRVVILRIGFGVVWALDAYLKWQPSFVKHFSATIAAGAKSAPGWISPWFRFWRDLVAHAPHVFAYAGAVTETMLALGLILGVGRRFLYLGGAIYALFIWSVPEGFGTPFAPGATDIGTAIMYAVLFAALYALDVTANAGASTLDTFLLNRFAWWRMFGQPGGHAMADVSTRTEGT